MYTVCPSCTRQFRIYAEHISAAAGQVRCGFCHEQFNALDRIFDEPLSNEKVLNGVQTSDEPQFKLSGDSEAEKSDVEKDVLISNAEANVDQELKMAIDEIDVKASVEQAENKVKETSAANKQTEVKIESGQLESGTGRKESEKEACYDFPEPEEILEEKRVEKSGLLTAFWFTASFIGFVVILAQLVWFNRDLILAKYPQFMPHAKQICQELDCRLIRMRDPAAIKLVNRDVRLHPRFEDTLLVNATMNNALKVRQPYPKVQLTLFDTMGALLGHRNFVPSDYLDDSIAIDEGMPVDSPVHFVLEVSGSTAGAVSFEFRFL